MNDAVSSAETCGATTRDGTPCDLSAGWGTDRDDGRCKLHGGAGGRPPTHGLYADALRSELREKMDAARAEPISDLRDEVALLRALLTRYMETVGTVDDDLGSVTTLVGEIRRTADTVSKIVARRALTADHIEYLRSRLARILREYVPKEDRADALNALRATVEADPSALDL